METSAPAAENRLLELISLPLLWISLSFLAGIILAGSFEIQWFKWAYVFYALGALLLILGIYFISVKFRQRSNLSAPALVLVCICFLFLGILRYVFQLPILDAKNIVFYADRDYEVLVTGWVKEMPDARDGFTNLKIETQFVDTGDGDLPISGLILAKVGANQKYEYGQVLRLRGKLKTPPDADEQGEFSYRDYLSIHTIYAYMTIAEATIYPETEGNFFFRRIYQIKTRSLENIYRIFPDPEASLLAGILLGVDTGLSKDIQQAFKNTGTSHIIAISGFNIAIIAGLFMATFSRWFGQRRGSVIAVFGIFFYTILVGADAAVLRAAFMGSLGLFARQAGRRQTGIVTLVFVAALMCFVFSPLYLWDVGFQLSFFATLGLILYAQPITDYFFNFIAGVTSPKIAKKLTKPFPKNIFIYLKRMFTYKAARIMMRTVSDGAILTFAAQLTAIPIMVYHFKQLSLVSFIANLFILPVQPAVMLISGAALLLSHVWIWLGKFAAFFAWPFALYTIRAVEFFNWKSWVLYFNNIPLWLPILFYGILFSMTFLTDSLKKLLKLVREFALIAALFILFTCVVFTWKYSFAGPDGRLHVSFFDVGSADAILVQSPSGRSVLINGGPKATLLSESLGRTLPPFSRQLDWLIIASTDEDQMTALPRILDRYPPSNVLWSGNPHASFSARLVDEWLTENQIPVAQAELGQRLELGDGAFIEVLAEGARGSVLLIEWKNFRALLPIGVDIQSLNMDADTLDVLLLADAGYAPSNPEAWIKQMNPQLIVLDVAASDEFGMPSQETLDAVGGYTLLRTDMNGWISISTDGDSMQIEVERK